MQILLVLFDQCFKVEMKNSISDCYLFEFLNNIYGYLGFILVENWCF